MQATLQAYLPRSKRVNPVNSPISVGMDPDSALLSVILKIKQQQQQQKRMRRTTTINNNQSYIRQAFVNIRMVDEWEVSWT